MIGCKKDKDTVPPIVTITSPYDNQMFNVYETFTIKAELTDDKKLVSVNIKLVNEQQAVMQSPVEFAISGKEYSLNIQYELYDVHLPNGNYYLRIEASDGESTGVGYMKIYIHETPTFRKSIYAITQSASMLNVVKIDSSLSLINKLSFTSDYSGSVLSSYYQYLFVSGIYSGGFSGIDVERGNIKWSVPPTNTGNPDFTSLTSANEKYYLSYFSGNVRAYNYSGRVDYQTQQMQDGYYPAKVIKNGDYVLVETKEKISSTKKLITCLANTGLAIREKQIQGDVVEFINKSISEVVLFSNNNGQGEMSVFNILSNSLFSPHTIPVGEILSALQIDADNFLIGHANGTIYRYEYSNSSLTTLMTGVMPYKMTYDVINNQLIVAEAKTIQLFNYSPALTTLDNTVALTDSILNVHVLFNK